MNEAMVSQISGSLITSIPGYERSWMSDITQTHQIVTHTSTLHTHVTYVSGRSHDMQQQIAIVCNLDTHCNMMHVQEPKMNADGVILFVCYIFSSC